MSLKAKLKVDIVSVKHETVEVIDIKAKKGLRVYTGPKVYGKKNDEVNVINDQGNVWIVEDSNGERFAVKETDLIIQ